MPEGFRSRCSLDTISQAKRIESIIHTELVYYRKAQFLGTVSAVWQEMVYIIPYRRAQSGNTMVPMGAIPAVQNGRADKAVARPFISTKI